MLDTTLVRIQEKGQVIIPVGLRRRLGLKKGDLVAVIETANGVLITSREALTTAALDRIGEVLGQQGPSLEELIRSGGEECTAIISGDEREREHKIEELMDVFSRFG